MSSSSSKPRACNRHLSPAWPRRSCVSRRATLPLRSGYSKRAPALIRPRLALPWHTSGTTPPPSPIASPITAFLLHARQQAAGGAVGPIPGAPAPAGVPRLPPLANSAEDDGAVDASSVTATRKRKVRGSHKKVAQRERKRQRRAASPVADLAIHPPK